MTALLAASLFLAQPAPLEMPKAEAYFVRESDGTRRLEDRYDTLDLWMTRAVDGIWRDEEGREFMVATLDILPPALAGSETSTKTRVDYSVEATPFDLRHHGDRLLEAIDRLAPIEPSPEYTKPRQLPRGYREVRYYQGTNTSAIVCAALGEKAANWRLVTWALAEGDDFGEKLAAFEKGVLYEGETDSIGLRTKTPPTGERELLRADARHSVEAYPNWHVTDSDEFTVLDDLTVSRSFITDLTNDLKVMRAKYARVMPTPVDGSNVLSVARIFATRLEYLEAAGEDMSWSAAYWNPSRRELVAYLTEGDGRKLRETIRHEAFHQYLSYALAMIPASPWLNEGYAQYFEDESADDWGMEVDFEALAGLIPPLLAMSYAEFYAGSDLERHLKYRLAWSIAYFLENGAEKVRFEPFRNLKHDYVEDLLETHDMTHATSAAFGNADNVKLFVTEWKKFWKNR